MRLMKKQALIKVWEVNSFFYLFIIVMLISNFLGIDLMIKTNNKNPRHFNLLEVIFKCELKM